MALKKAFTNKYLKNVELIWTQSTFLWNPAMGYFFKTVFRYTYKKVFICVQRAINFTACHNKKHRNNTPTLIFS